MNLPTLERRVRTLELLRQRLDKPGSCRPAQSMNYGLVSWNRELADLTQEATLITEQAKAAGDLRVALASIRERCCILELAAKLSGDLDERSSTNVVNVNLDPETAKKMAEIYLGRHKAFDAESK